MVTDKSWLPLSPEQVVQAACRASCSWNFGPFSFDLGVSVWSHPLLPFPRQPPGLPLRVLLHPINLTP